MTMESLLYMMGYRLIKATTARCWRISKSLDKTVWCANPSDTEFTQNFSSRNPVIFYGDTDLLKQQYPQYKYYKLNITEAADCKGDEEWNWGLYF